MTQPTRQQKKRMFNARKAGIALFALAMVVGAVVGLAFERPTVSALENRNLTAFPEFSITRFLDGSFFSDLSLWYADTYPAREALVRVGQGMKSAYGIQASEQMLGSGKQADEIPDELSEEELEAARQAERERQEQEALDALEGGDAAAADEEMLANIQEQLVGNIYLVGDAAYSFYWFSQAESQAYADTISNVAEALDGQAQVYSLLVPTSGGAMLSDQEREAASASDESKALDYFASVFSDKVKMVNCYDALRAHNDEYLYYRTDHHWTQVGAYYAYVEFCKQRGTEPADVLSWKQIDSGDFLGSLYSELGAPAEMAYNPDNIVGYVPTSTNDLLYEFEGEMIENHVIQDASDWDLQSKYLSFITGDQPLIQIDNPKRTDGSSCLVVKDSYGNPFVPCIVDDYQTVYVIDVRYSSRNIIDFVRENGIKDVIFENSLSLTADYTIHDLLVSQTTGY